MQNEIPFLWCCNARVMLKPNFANFKVRYMERSRECHDKITRVSEMQQKFYENLFSLPGNHEVLKKSEIISGDE